MAPTLLNDHLNDINTTARIAKLVPDNTDYNTLMQPGWYNIYSTVNAPGANRFLVRVDSVNADADAWITVQHAYSVYTSTAPDSPKQRNICNTPSGYVFTPWI
jgi:hypothetical protein